MAIYLDTASIKGATSDASIHLLPCEIESSGSAKVEQYFTPTIKDTENGQTASLRGRPLSGKVLQIPSGYTGIVMREPRKIYNEEEERQFKVSHTFREFTYWNLDTPATANDRIVKVMDWFDLADVIHSPVTENAEATSS